MELLPPLVFEPRFIEKIWGGRRLETSLGKKLPPQATIGESWEIFDFPPGFTDGNPAWVSATVAAGPMKGRTLHELMGTHEQALLGPGHRGVEVAGGGARQFPLLVKFLDAREDLSIQVHPTPEYAAAHPGAALKTECWIVLDREPGASLYKGLKPATPRPAFEAAIADGSVAGLIERVPARVGDCHFLPSGAVHALGAGVLVAEVQTPSDTTYRVFDFGRVDSATGKPRKLHVNEALNVIDFNSPPTLDVRTVDWSLKTGGPLVDCQFFKTTALAAPARSVRPLGRGEMKIWLVTEGSVRIRWAGDAVLVRKGGVVLIPAGVVAGVVAGFEKRTIYLETVLG